MTEAASADRLLLEVARHHRGGTDGRRAPQLTQRHPPGADCAVLGRGFLRGGRCDAVLDQFLDVAPYLRQLPGLSLNFDNAGIALREGMNRAAGTSVHPIELGVVAGMLLPLAI